MNFAMKVQILAVAAAAVFVVILVKKKGAAAALGEEAARAAAKAAVDMAGGLVKGTINGISEGVGIPTLDETLTDNGECRQFMNAYGVWESIGKCGAPTFVATGSGSLWDWFATPSASDYTLKPSTGAFDRQL